MTRQNTYIAQILIALIMLVMGVGEVWADTWDGTVPSTANVSKAECNKIGITGSGTQADPYIISTAKQFAYFASKMNGNTAWWKLKGNIVLDLNGDNYVWTYGQNNWTFKGHFDGNGSTISNMKLATNGANKSFGLFSAIQGNSATDHAYIKNLIISGITIETPDKNTSYSGTTNIGLLIGKANGNVDIENVTVSGGSITHDATTTGGNYIGALVGQLSNDNNTVSGCTVKNNVSISTGEAEKKDFQVGGLVGNAANNALIKDNTVTVSISLAESTSGNNYIGGLIGYAKGSNSTASTTLPMGKRVVVKGNTVTPTIKMNGQVVTASLALGGLFGYADNHVNIINNKVTSPAISVTNNIQNASYVGGAIGYMTAYSYADGMTVSGGSIAGPTSDKTVNNNVIFFVGGFLGYQNTSGTGDFQANKFKNIAVSGLNINLGHYVPVSDAPIANHKFSVGGIAASVNAPNMKTDGSWSGMPENLIFKGGRIYAPWASTNPLISIFNNGVAAHNNLTPDVITTVDAIEKAKVNTWYYYDYKLGLSSAFLSSTSVIAEKDAPAYLKFRKNYSKTTETIDGIQYLSIDNSTLTRVNRYQDSERDLKTVLWWTQQASMDQSKSPATVAAVTCFTANEQPIYPQSGAASTAAGNLIDYPYYMYFFQGVGNAKYASKTDAENIIKGIEANFTNDVMPAVAMASETNLNVTITNDGETRRGFDDRTLSVTVKQGSTDATSNYTFQWYIDGKADGTGTTKTLTPHWKDGQGVTVNVLSGTKIVATASYGFAPGMLHTKASAANATAELVRSDYNSRGTSTNPYIIDCESALRQLSYLSTVHTSMRWDGVQVPSVDPKSQSQGHYNRAYYVLTNDIDLGNREFIPISHVGYGGDGSWGTYNTNWIFQGVFDGNGHKISNFNIIWSASQYVGNNANLYYGLFGAVGGSAETKKWGDAANSNTIIKKLIIDSATLTHNTSETSFYYDQSISTNSNNCCVGVLTGIVSNNVTIQDIEIRNSKITDEGSRNYSLAAKGLYVGGAIGSYQLAYGTTSNVPANTQIQHIAAQVDITLTRPQIADVSAVAQLSQFNVGGIIGRYIATSATKDQAEATMPKYTIYSGVVKTPRAWVSPILGALRYTSQQATNDWKNYSKQYEGNNNTDATQIHITNALYYNFYIDTDKITDAFPTNTCKRGSRTMSEHVDIVESAIMYNALKYQGVNYEAKYLDMEGASLEYLNESRTDGYNWLWEDGFVHLSTDPYVEAKITRDENTFTASLIGATAVSYAWKLSFDGETWYDIPDESSATYTEVLSPKQKFIRAFISDGSKEYPTLPMVVEAVEICTPAITYSDNTQNRTYTANLNVVDGIDISHLDIEYQWYDWNRNLIPGATNQTYSLSMAEVNQNHEVVWCVVTIKEYGLTLAEYTLMAGGTVVYIDGTNGIDNVDGSTERGWTDLTPVKTIDHANSLLKSKAEGGTMDNNIIVVMGTLNPNPANFTNKDTYTNPFQSNGKKPATLTGYYGKDYQGEIVICEYSADENSANPFKTGKGHNCYVLGDTKFENLVMRGGSASGNSFIECHGNDVTFGKGLVMTNFNNLSKGHGNLNTAQTVPEFTIILTATNLVEDDIKEYTTRTKPQVVTFQSGHYGRVMGGRYTNGFFANADNTSHTILGSPKHPVWAVVNIEFDEDNEMTDGGSISYTCDINCVIAGLTDGTMYGDYEINHYGGRVCYIVGGNQGNPVANGTATYKNTGVVDDEFEKNWGQWPNASYFGRSVINIDQQEGLKNITIDNIYAGGLGREANGNNAKSIVDMYVYGQTEVNIKNGTVNSCVYAGGAGGVLGSNPWDAHAPYATTEPDNPAAGIMNGVQYGDTRVGTWSSKTADAALADVTLHKRLEDGTYEPFTINLANSSATINISGGAVNGDVYGGGFGQVEDMPAAVTMQGVGSVFGTSNIIISGGTITGSVFGGSRGSSVFYHEVNKYGQTIDHIAEMNGTINLTITGTEENYPYIKSAIYGAGRGLSTAPRKATQADVDAGKAANVGDTYTEEYPRIATAGNTDLGEGYKTNVNITIDLPESVPFPNDIYGGGQMGLVDGNTNIVLKRGTFTGNIYGGGYGEKEHLDKALITGNTSINTGAVNPVDVDPNAPVTIKGGVNIYGGGDMAQVKGDTYININHGNVTADVFGGGRGLTQNESAGNSSYGKVTGNTRVLVNNQTQDNILTGNIYGGGALGAVQGNTTVVLKAGEIDGNIFGGGKGEEGSDKAKVTGDANVIVDNNWTEPTPEP